MALSGRLVFVEPNWVRYLFTHDGAAGNTASITTTGAASPDLLTDTVAGPLRNLVKANLEGFGQIAAGIGNAQAAALWESNQVVAAGGAVVGAVPGRRTAIMNLTLQTGQAIPNISASGDGAGRAVISVFAGAQCTFYVDIFVPWTIG